MKAKKSLFTTQNQAFPDHLAGFCTNLGAMPIKEIQEILKIEVSLLLGVIETIAFNPKGETFISLMALGLTRKIQKWIFKSVLRV